METKKLEKYGPLITRLFHETGKTELTENEFIIHVQSRVIQIYGPKFLASDYCAAMRKYIVWTPEGTCRLYDEQGGKRRRGMSIYCTEGEEEEQAEDE
jgi:hypothetical protein